MIRHLILNTCDTKNTFPTTIEITIKVPERNQLSQANAMKQKTVTTPPSRLRQRGKEIETPAKLKWPLNFLSE